MTDLADLVAALEAENDELRERVRQLEKEVGMAAEIIIPLEWRLTGKETTLLRALVSRELCSKEFILEFIYGTGADEPPEMKIVDVFVCKARKKIEPFGVKILTTWGRGYSLDPETRARFGKRPTGVEHAA